MKHELSILIPTYNDVCVELASSLSRQAETIEGLAYEIIVADDGSTDEACIEANEAISLLPNAIFIKRGVNCGRSVIRNFLAQQARYQWLLFVDSDMKVHNTDFLHRYLTCDGKVVYGGYTVGEGTPENLRYIYEKEAAPRHTVEERRKQPFRDFHTANFLIHAELMKAHPFDERFRSYGYEDVLLGKQLRKAGVAIDHIDNPLGFDTFEDNPHFVSKTEEGLRTLHQFRNELRGYSQLLTLVGGIHLRLVSAFIRLWHRLFGPLERRNLCGRHPSLTLFRLYRLGYYLNINYQ